MAAQRRPARLVTGVGGSAMNERDDSRCAACGGRVTATHMLLRTYPLDTRGRWQRCPADFSADLAESEDIVVACADCGQQPAGRVHRCANRFWFTPTGGT